MIGTAQPHNLCPVTPGLCRAHLEGNSLSRLHAEGVCVAQEWLAGGLEGQLPAVSRWIDAVILAEDERAASVLFPALPEQGPVGLGQRRIPVRVKDVQRVPFGPRGARQVPQAIPPWLHDHEASRYRLPA